VTPSTDSAPEEEARLASFLERRREAAAAAWGLDRELVLIHAGERIAVPGRGDQTYPFRAHAEYLYLTDRERPSGVLAFDPQDGWTDFVAPTTEHELLWEGGGAGGSDGTPLPELSGWLAAREGRPIARLGAPGAGAPAEQQLDRDVRAGLNRVRRPKDALELARMRRAEQITREAFAEVVPQIEAGRSERELQLVIETAFRRRGVAFVAYDTIVGSGPNSAVLHFPPTDKRLADGELVLIDAGAEYRAYASDVTRTYPVSGRFTPEQAELVAIVRAAGEAATRRCTAGARWTKVHREAALVVAEGLVAFGLLRGEPEALVEQGADFLFFPHGVGHMVGLGVRDTGELLRTRAATADDESAAARIDLELVPGQVLTVEPGIYFVPALLRDPERRARHRDAVDWDRVERMLDFGGIRIENNVLITDGAPEVLTADVPVPA